MYNNFNEFKNDCFKLLKINDYSLDINVNFKYIGNSILSEPERFYFEVNKKINNNELLYIYFLYNSENNIDIYFNIIKTATLSTTLIEDYTNIFNKHLYKKFDIGEFIQFANLPINGISCYKINYCGYKELFKTEFKIKLLFILNFILQFFNLNLDISIINMFN